MARLLMMPLMLTAVAEPVKAQLSRFEDLPLRLTLGDTVTVTDATGDRWKGRLVGLAPEEIVVSAGARDVTLYRAVVRQVGVCCDSLANGALIGAAPGLFVGFMAGYGFAGRAEPGDGLAAAAILGGITAGIGLGIDALMRGDRVVYRAPTTVSLDVDPVNRAVGLRVTWGRR